MSAQPLPLAEVRVRDLIAERDRARVAAVALEQENAQLRKALNGAVAALGMLAHPLGPGHDKGLSEARRYAADAHADTVALTPEESL